MIGPIEDYPYLEDERKTVFDLMIAGNLDVIEANDSIIHWEHSGTGQYISEILRGDFKEDGLEDIVVYSYTYAVDGTLGYGNIEVWSDFGRKTFERVTV